MTERVYRYPDLYYEQRLMDMELRTGGGAAEWSEKHGGACPMCGSHDGMEAWEPEDVAELSTLKTRKWYRYTYAQGDVAVYTPCVFCPTDYERYTEADPLWVARWVERMLSEDPEEGEL